MLGWGKALVCHGPSCGNLIIQAVSTSPFLARAPSSVALYDTSNFDGTQRSAEHPSGARLEGVEQAHDMRVVHLGQHVPLRFHMVHLPAAQAGCA